MLKIYKKENSNTYVFTKSMGLPPPGMSIERSIIYITKDNSCYKKTTDVGGDVDQSHTAKNLNV